MQDHEVVAKKTNAKRRPIDGDDCDDGETCGNDQRKPSLVYSRERSTHAAGFLHAT